ncbi:RagB/SusD family nutrient uptake outer membrane protein, partial [bacterium]|nr:RagB/SusD family nutrient uptake outer membrane protein [bacterium]
MLVFKNISLMKIIRLNMTYLRVAIIFAVLSIVLLSGCEKDLLEKQPLDRLSTSTFWKTENDAMLALTGVYYLEGTESQGAKQRYSFWNQDTYLRIFEATTDNGFEKDNGVTDFNNGDMAPTYNPVRQLWENAYLKIAKCNNFMDNIDAVDMDPGKMAEMKAEVKTIRAWDYFNLAFYWGDVPLVETLLTIDEANNVTRTPRDQVMSFVLSELQDATAVLPSTRPGEEKGRITKGGALALLGRVQMAEKLWTNAANTYKQIMDLEIYEIDSRFKELFEDDGENSTEIILSMKRMPELYGNSIQLSTYGFTWGGYHHYSPYNELVEQFECIDGLPIDESPLYDIDDPYKDRDPRLY